MTDLLLTRIEPWLSAWKANVLAIYLIISGFVFVVCPSRTIFGNRKGAHVHLEGWKHGNSQQGGKAKHGVYAVAVVMVAMARTCTCNCQLRCGSAFL